MLKIFIKTYNFIGNLHKLLTKNNNNNNEKSSKTCLSINLKY